MDKEFMNFLINLDKERKSQSKEMRVNQAYEIYCNIAKTDNKFCFIVDNKDTVDLISDMTPNDAIDFIKFMCKLFSSNDLFSGSLLMLACELIKENYDISEKSYKKFFWNELSNVLRALRNDKKMPDYFLAKIASISVSRFNRIIELLSAIKGINDDND